MNAVITLNFLIAKIYYALIIFSFSQRHNLLKITNLTLKEESEKENEENKKNKKEEKNNKKEKFIKKIKARRK